MAGERGQIPDHVPPELVVDFDFFALGDKPEGVQLAFAKLHEGPDIVWTPYNGGHWIATRAADIEAIQRDHEHFSNRHFTLPRNDFDALAIPLGLDPPSHTPFRRLLMGAFTPKAVKALEGVARETARELVARLAPSGKCEFIADFARMLPINVFLGMVNLPLGDKEFLLPWAEAWVRSPELQARMEAQSNILNYLAKYVDERTANPGDDLLSMISRGEIEGRPITRDEILQMATVLMGGGLDTVASALGIITHFLANNPKHRAELVANPRLNQIACEELLRRFGLVNTCRVLTMNHTHNGINLRKDDLILTPTCLYGLDDRANNDPTTVDFHRTPSSIRHAAFGSGPHTCPGAVLARREIMVFFDEWLPVIPDFELDPDDKAAMASGGANGVLRLPIRWSV